MEYKIEYNPKSCRSFNDKNHLTNFVNMLLRTDVTRRGEGPLTRYNLYFLRKDGELQHFQNVTSRMQRMEIKPLVMECCKSYPLDLLRNDRILITPYPSAAERAELFSELTEERLPALWDDVWKGTGKTGKFLSNTLLVVMHNDESMDGETLQCNIHRIFVV